MDVDTIIGLVGILLTLIFGFLGVRYFISRRSMNQNAKNGSIAIQSGRDTKIDGGSA